MADREKLIKLLVQSTQKCGNTDCNRCKYWNTNDCGAARMADIVISDGWIRPPCKVGTEIFGLFDNDDEQRKEIYEGKIICYSLDENNLLWAKMKYKNGLTYWHTIDDFGKTVFSTPEEAKKALEEDDDEENN